MLLTFLAKTALCAVFAILFLSAGLAQSRTKTPAVKKPAAVGPKVTQIDTATLGSLLKPREKPLLINFWATWCDPCREEFPELVKIDSLYRDRIDFITISLDDLADIKTSVPKFLGENKAEMPAYLLKTDDESAAISMVAKEWSGSLPLTILLTSTGETAYIRMGKIKYETMIEELDRVLSPPSVSGLSTIR